MLFYCLVAFIIGLSMESETQLMCVRCGFRLDEVRYVDRCPQCGGLLVPTFTGSLRRTGDSGVWVWGRALYTAFMRPKVTLGEGHTPLTKSTRIGRSLKANLYFKDESKNPTGSFIDRGAATLATALRYFRVRSISVASTGDLGISVSTYVRRVGLTTRIYVPSSVTLSKAYKTLLTGGKVRFVDSYEEALLRASRAVKLYGAMIPPSHPYLMDGYRTIAFEILHELSGKKPLNLVVPIGDGVLTMSLYQAFKDLNVRPKFLGVKACRESPLLREIYVMKPMLHEYLEEIASLGILEIVDVCDDEALEASELTIKNEGFLVGPVGASCIAALLKAGPEAVRGKVTVALMTGDPLQDPYIMKALLERTAGTREELLTLGFTKTKILEMLAYGDPTHPYMIWKGLRSRYGLSVSRRTVYKHVEELIDAGLLKVVSYKKVGGRLRKVISITESGLRYLT
ncbi:MAG: pyridoxal-phosphate dependent enzyme [Zestosphaera sp.]